MISQYYNILKPPPPKKKRMLTKNLGVRYTGLPTKLRFSDSQIPKSVFSKDAPVFSCMFQSNLMRIGRATGPDFDKILEVPESIQKVLQYDKGP